MFILKLPKLEPYILGGGFGAGWSCIDKMPNELLSLLFSMPILKLPNADCLRGAGCTGGGGITVETLLTSCTAGCVGLIEKLPNADFPKEEPPF